MKMRGNRVFRDYFTRGWDVEAAWSTFCHLVSVFFVFLWDISASFGHIYSCLRSLINNIAGKKLCEVYCIA